MSVSQKRLHLVSKILTRYYRGYLLGEGLIDLSRQSLVGSDILEEDFEDLLEEHLEGEVFGLGEEGGGLRMIDAEAFLVFFFGVLG